jgi:serine/threonine protein kinase
VTSIVDENEFNGLTEELTEQREQYVRVKEKLQTGTAPVKIPTTPRLSLKYEDIAKGDPIGSGGNADVYRAKATTNSDEITLAIKEPRMSGTIDTETMDQLINEAETWQQLDDHDHIVSVIDYGSTPLPWIGIEYMDGGDLGERAWEVSFEQTIWTALAITKGVRYAHKQGVAHFDIKPSNILFRSVEDAWDVPKVADWGLSKHLLEHSQSVEGMSPRYAAPEQLDSEQFGETDTVTDVYQLGTVLYELFTGEPPYEGQTYEVMNKIQSSTPELPSETAGLPEAVDDIVLTALATERDDRYDDVIYLRDALRELWEDYN